MRKRGLTLLLTVSMLVLLFGINSFAFTNVIGKSGASGANIRAEATTSSKIVASVPANTELTICGETTGSDGNKWYLVFVDKNQTGYIRADIITNTGVAAGGETPNSTATGTTSGSSSNSTTGSTTTTDNQTTDIVIDQTTPGSDCTLATLTIGSGTLEPAFSSDVYHYTLTVEEGVDKVSVYAITTDENATIPDDISFRDLEQGSNDRSIIVTGADGTSATYTFMVIRGEIVTTPEVIPDDTVTDEPASEKPVIDDTENNLDTSKSGINLGFYKWIMIIMAFVIVILIMVVVYMTIQMHDMRETISELERERRRRRRKAQAMHKISTNDRQDTATIERTEESLYNEKPQYKEPQYEEFNQTEVQYNEPQYDEVRYEEPANTRENFQQPLKRRTQENNEELEDIQEREATTEKRVASRNQQSDRKNKDGWRPVNFLAPEDDMDFEFLDLDDEDK